MVFNLLHTFQWKQVWSTTVPMFVAVRMPNVLVVNVNVYQNITATHISIAGQNVYSVLIVIHKKHVFKENVSIPVLAHVGRMPFAKL